MHRDKNAGLFWMVCMRIAKTAALVLAMAPLLAVAQLSGGRLERKPSPATSATSAPSGSSAPPGTQAAPSLQPAINPYRANLRNSPGPIAPRPAAPSSLGRPVPAIPAQPVAPKPVPLSVAISAPAVVAQPVVSPAPSPEPRAAVNYAAGELTVVSQSASLETVLKLISAKTGAVIDLAPELQNEPVIAQIGPSAVRDVMTALLDSPKIDYIIMGSGGASGGVERILVRTRHSFGRSAIAMSRPPQPLPAEQAEFKFANGAPPAGVAKPQTPLTQEQLMENWKKVREEKKLAEIEQQQRERANEANQVELPLQPEPEPQAVNAPPDNPPLK
jgi:hypothetical protein